MENIAGKNFRILERKSSSFGSVGHIDVGNELEKRFAIDAAKLIDYYDNLKRSDIYRTALDKYTHDQLARPIVNLVVHAIFSKDPDFQGDEELVKRAKQIVRDSYIDWSSWGRDLEVCGDVFLSLFQIKAKTIIAPLPANTISVDCDQNNILNIKQYIQFPRNDVGLTQDGFQAEQFIPSEDVSHIKINCTSNMLYGSSILRNVFWWLDVLDNLWERNWIRGGQYYGAPIVVITGVPSDYQAAVKASLETDGQRPGRNWIFPPEVKVETLDFTKNYPIENLIDRIYQYILAACNVPQHLVYESDSSRGVAMFSADGFEMMIRNRQRTWELGLTKIFRRIFENEGLWRDESNFRIRWSPVFTRDLKSLAQIMQTGVELGVLSKQTARELIGVDHSEEVERIKDMEKNEPDPEPQVPDVPNKVASKPAPKNS